MTHVLRKRLFSAVYMSYLRRNVRLFHVSTLPVLNFRIFQLMYPRCVCCQPLDLVLGWLTTVGCVLSLVSLAVCLLVFTAIPAVRRDPSLDGYMQALMAERAAIHRSLCFCLFAAELILLAGMSPQPLLNQGRYSADVCLATQALASRIIL